MTVQEAILILNANVIIACERAGFDSVTVKMIEDALDTIEDALKAQEPLEPIIDTYWETPSVCDDDVKVTEHKCGACGAGIDKWDKYCRVCGKAVKWDA